MQNRTTIVKAINQMIGLAKLFEIEKIESANLSDVNIPFLSESLNGKKGIRITFAPGHLILPSDTKSDRYTRQFQVLFDEDAKRIILVTSTLTDASISVPREAATADAEADLRHTVEEYKGFPDSPPTITFMDALDSVHRSAPIEPAWAKEIDGVYVMHSLNGEKARPMWIIRFRGVPSLETRLGPDWESNSLRSVIDASTGKRLFSTNTPFTAKE
jgi:hypothetical protein